MFFRTICYLILSAMRTSEMLAFAVIRKTILSRTIAEHAILLVVLDHEISFMRPLTLELDIDLDDFMRLSNSVYPPLNRHSRSPMTRQRWINTIRWTEPLGVAVVMGIVSRARAVLAKESVVERQEKHANGDVAKTQLTG
jgi:hypothetical protein